MTTPKIVCVIGSMRFEAAMRAYAAMETLAGNVVLLPHVNNKNALLTPMDLSMLLLLHRQMIDMADRVYVVNVGGYIGDATASEVLYAATQGIPLNFLEPPSPEFAREIESKVQKHFADQDVVTADNAGN